MKEEHLYYFGDVVKELKKSKNQWETEYITRMCDIIIRQGYFDRINYNYEAFPSFNPNYMTETDIIRDKQLMRLSKIIGIVLRGYNTIIKFDIRASNLIIYYDNFVKENPHKFYDENNVTFFLKRFEKFIDHFEKKLGEQDVIYRQIANQFKINDERGILAEFPNYIH